MSDRMAGVMGQDQEFFLGELLAVHEDDAKDVVEFIKNGGFIGRVKNLEWIRVPQYARHPIRRADAPRFVFDRAVL